jgi:hypothetical protein
MGRASDIAAAVCAFALAGAGAAHAQSATRLTQGPAVTPVDQAWTVKSDKKTLQWTEGRWGLKLDYSQPVGRPTEWNDVEAGAFFKLSPQLRVGGSLGLGEPMPDPARPPVDERAQPRVRLETTFKF